MKDRTLLWAIVISLMVHLAGVCILGFTSSARFQTASASPLPRFVKVNFVQDPFAAPVKPKPVKVAPPIPTPTRPTPAPERNIAIPIRTVRVSVQPNPIPARRSVVLLPGARVGGAGSRVPGNPGGKLNVGTLNSHADLGGNWGGGRTPVGWVPGGDKGGGAGSGNSPGAGTPEPPKHVSEGPGTRPAPAPAAPPAPKVVSEPEFKSRLADRANPVLSHDSRPSIPGSVEDGLSVSVKVEFTVTADGGVSGVEIVKSSGNREVDRAVSSAAARRKYKPAVQDGVPRAVKVSVTYQVNT